MGLTSALNTSLNGLALNESQIDVLGNNIANAGTNGFKASSVRFETQLSRTLSIGSKAEGENGGTNPRQVGLGAATAAISRDFTQGSISNSSSPSDLAIQGSGFFVLDGTNGRQYTRNGNFSLNSDSSLVNDQGQFVQGYGVDSNFNLVTTTIGKLNIPLGELHVAQATNQINMSGALFPTGNIATTGSLFTSDQLKDSSTAAAATATSLLKNTTDATGNSLFSVGDVLEFTPKKGGRTLDPVPYTVTATSTVQDLMTMIQNTTGIQQNGYPAGVTGIPNDGAQGVQPGITIDATGHIQILGNSGTVNALNILNGDLKSTTGAGHTIPLTFNKSLTQDATGESTSTDFVVYDSLGQSMTVRMTAVLEARTGGQSASTRFRYYLESTDDSGPNVALTSGTISFDSTGKVNAGGSASFKIDRSSTAAVSPQQITINFDEISGISSATSGSTLNMKSQNGSAPGTLQSFVIDEGGVVNGVFDNGIIRSLGQVVIARFPNPAGLQESAGTTFKEGVSSGSPAIVTAGNFGAGTVRAGAIELSNTDIGKSLVDLIVSSTNYRGNARVISSVDQLVNELLQLGSR